MKRYDFISHYSIHDLVPVLKDGKWGFVTGYGYKEVVAPKYSKCPEANDRYYITVFSGNQKGLINKDGKEILPTIYKDIQVENQDRIIATCADGSYVIVDFNGTELIRLVYDDISYYTDDIIIVSKDGVSGVVTISGEVKVPLEYVKICYELKANMFTCKKKDVWGVISTQNKIILPFEFDGVKVGQHIKVYKNGCYGIYNCNGKCIIYPDKYTYITETFGDLFIVEIDDYEGVVDKFGANFVPCKYRSIGHFMNGYAMVENDDGLYGYINVVGREICKLEYEEAKDFVNGMAAVKLNGKWGYINIIGKLTVPAIYDNCSCFYEKGYAVVSRCGKCTVIDQKGKELFPLIYDDIREIYDDHIKVTYNGEYGIVKL